MPNIYLEENDNAFIIYPNGRNILLRRKTGEMIGRPVTIAADYSHDMTDIIYNGVIYYAYINDEGQIVLKSVNERNNLYKTDISGDNVLANPKITVFNRQLLLFYSLQNPIDNTYSIKCVLPFDTEKSLVIPDTFMLRPEISIITYDEYMIITIHSNFYQKLLMIDTRFVITELKNPTELIASEISRYEEKLEQLKLDFDKEKEQLNQNYEKQMQSITSLHNEELEKHKALHNQELEKIEKKISELNNKVSIKDAEIAKLNSMIDSVAKQYNELMDVATQYKNEAIKWQKKFYGG